MITGLLKYKRSRSPFQHSSVCVRSLGTIVFQLYFLTQAEEKLQAVEAACRQAIVYHAGMCSMSRGKTQPSPPQKYTLELFLSVVDRDLVYITYSRLSGG